MDCKKKKISFKWLMQTGIVRKFRIFFPVIFLLINLVNAPAENIETVTDSIKTTNSALSDSPLSNSSLPEENIQIIKNEFVIPYNSLLSETALSQQLTKYYIEQYSSSGGVKFLKSVIERGSLYLPFIHEEIQKRGLPAELAYLPIIESNFVIAAKSRSGASGLWQFMLNSISSFDMKVTDLIDERRDFIKSTKAALQKLEDNYKALGNWELALAAYNSGLNAVNKTVQRTKIRDYWELCKKKEFRQETINYVPKFYAALFILAQPELFGINEITSEIEWTSIQLDRMVSLDVLSSEAKIDKNLLYRLNGELLYGISPMDKNYRLKVPAENLEQINEILERKDIALIRYYRHEVRHKDTLWSISRHYETTLAIIEQHNPGISNRFLKIGEIIIIPAFKEIFPVVREKEKLSFDGKYTVKKGDTLWSLGIFYGVDPQVLAEENNMELNSILREGRIIKVPIL